VRHLVAALVLALLATRPVGAGDAPLVVIVHPSRTDTLGLSDLAGIYLRKRRLWYDGAPIVPLNREAGSAARETFSVRVLGSDSTHLASYWNDAYFNGIFPPAVLSSSAAVKRYVASEPQAIGYIDPADVDDSVRVVLTLLTKGPREHRR
jgi:ABC-type phosphate transport system substrate-binding protein